MLESAYWAGTGKHQKEYEEMYEKLVPNYGESNTAIGELLRKMARASYRYYNDGDINSYGFFAKARPYEKEIKKEMSHPEEYDTWKNLVNRFKGEGASEKQAFKYHKEDYEKAMEATIDGTVKYAYKIYKSGKLKNRLLNVELFSPAEGRYGSHPFKWTLIKSTGERIYLPSKEKAMEYARKKGWKVKEVKPHKKQRR